MTLDWWYVGMQSVSASGLRQSLGLWAIIIESDEYGTNNVHGVVVER